MRGGPGPWVTDEAAARTIQRVAAVEMSSGGVARRSNASAPCEAAASESRRNATASID